MKPKLYPLTFHPIYKEKLWGGRRFAELFGRSLPSGPIGESWDVAAHPNGVSVVAQGELAGRSLEELVNLYGIDLVGFKGRQKDGKFPLLLKFIDARQDLSVQVHPDDEYAALNIPGELGKTEMWYIVHSDPGAWIIWGLRPGVTRERFSEAVKKGGSAILDCLNKVQVKAGEIYPISAGLVHALGAGVVVAEVQQNSDTTYRVYDWDRVDDQGQPRDLHITQALEVIDFSQEAYSMDYHFARCSQHFLLQVHNGPTTKTIELEDSFHIVTSVDRDAHITADGSTTKIGKGQSCLVPACLKRYVLDGKGIVLQSSLP
ncbi:MAG: class I mannose-6-phosphate isomerase [Firmicutes bacterium]|mgnify:CR=1 FL=1|nr:class I mannose-6-phosphate isomerase [Bacillota bacterium]